MYFWKIEKLKKDIQAKQLTEKDRFIYLFINILLIEFILVNVADIGMLFEYSNSNIWDSVDSILSVLIVALGTLFAFKANGGTTGTDFLGKFFSVSFVVNIRFLVILLTILAIYFYTPYSFLENETTLLNIIPANIWYIALYWRIFKHIKDVNDS